ncbi:MAG: hypothetical protein ACOYN4_19885 [Bacteroidales bacterium]
MNIDRIVSPTRLCQVKLSLTTSISEGLPIEVKLCFLPHEAKTTIANKQNTKFLEIIILKEKKVGHKNTTPFIKKQSGWKKEV